MARRRGARSSRPTSWSTSARTRTATSRRWARRVGGQGGRGVRRGRRPSAEDRQREAVRGAEGWREGGGHAQVDRQAGLPRRGQGRLPQGAGLRRRRGGEEVAGEEV